jgi:hypothetical protein
MARKLNLGWNTDNNKGAFVIKGHEIKSSIVGGHLIQWFFHKSEFHTYLTTGGGDTWMCHGFIEIDSVMDSFFKFPKDWTLLHCPSGEERSWF